MDMKIFNRMMDISDKYDINPMNLMELYSQKQSQYLHRDLKKGADIGSVVYANEQGKRAIDVIEAYINRKGIDEFKKLLD